MSNQDDDVQMEIDKPASGGAGERTGSPTTSTTSGTTHLILGGAFGMKIPPPEYSGIPQKMANKDSELPDVAKMKPEVGHGDSKANIVINAELSQYSESKPTKRSKKKKNKAVPEEIKRPLIMPLISAPPSIVTNPPSRITGPIELDEDDLKEVREQSMGRYQGRRGRGRLQERGHMDDRGMMMEDRIGRMDDRGGRMDDRGGRMEDRGGRMDDRGRMMEDRGDEEGSPGRNGRGNWQRPRHGKYKYPDDFDEEDFEEGFGGGDGDYGNDYDEYGPSRERGPPHDRGRQGPSGRDFGQGPRPFGQRPNFQGPHHAPPGPAGYGTRNFGQEGSYGPDGPGNYGPHGFGQGPMLGGPRGPPPLISISPGGPSMGQGGAMGSGNFPQHGFGSGPGMGHGPPQGQGFREGYQGSPGQGFAPPTQGPWQGEGFPPPPPPPQPNFNMPPQQQQQTFSGEVFNSEGFNPSFQGMPLPDAVQPTPPVAQESAENLIAMGMNPDLAKILDADSKNRPKTDSISGTPKKKSKKKKKKGELEKLPEPEQSFDVDEVILPMSIPLPDDVPLPPEPKKKKKKKKDKDLENVMFPPLPDSEPMVGPAPKPATPPIPVLQAEHIVVPPPVDRPETMPQLPPEGPPIPSQYKQQSQFLPPERSQLQQQLPLPIEQLQASIPQPMLQTQPAPPIPQAVPQPVQRSIQQSIYDGQPVPAQIFCTVPQSQPVQIISASVQAQQVSRQMADQVTGQSSLPHGVSAVPPFHQIQSQGQMVSQVAMQGSTIVATREAIVQGQVVGMHAPTVPTIQQPVIQSQLGQQVIGQGVTVSQMPQLQSVQQSSVRRSRFDPNWTPDLVAAPAVVSMIQQVPMTIHQTTVSPVQLPIMQQSLSHPGPSSSPVFQNTTAIQQVVSEPSPQQTGVEQQIQQSQAYQSVQPAMPVIEQTIRQQEIPIQNLNMMNQEFIPTPELEEDADSRMSHENVEMISEHVHDTQNEDIIAMETDATETLPESEEQHLQKSDDNYVYFENKAAQKEEQTAESQIPKEPVTASQLLEKFKQKRQLKKIDNKSEFTKFPVVLPTPLIQMAASKEEIKLQDKGQGKFTFAIRKLKQLEAEKEEEEKQVLTALSTEQEQKKEIPVRELINKDADLEKFKQDKLSREKVTDVKPKSLFKERKKKSKSPEKKSRSRSDSREKKKSKIQKSVSRDRSRSRGRKSRSRERSKSRDRQRKSSPKIKERSLSPWRKDREFYKRYGRFPRPGEADSITYESNSSRDRGRFNDRNRGSRISSSRWSPERSREREKSRDRRSHERESRNRKSKDRESRDRRSRERESTEQIKDRKDRKRSGERGEKKVNRESEDKENKRSREKKHKDKEGKNKDWKRSRDDSSSENDSSSESESEDDRKKQNKQLVANRRTRSSSTERSRKMRKDRSVSLDKKKNKSKGQNKESETVTIKMEPLEQIEYDEQGKDMRETKSYATVGNLYEGLDATDWKTQREEKQVEEAVQEEAMETFETGNEKKGKEKIGSFSDDAEQKTVKAAKEHRREERDQDISRIYEEPKRAVSKQYEEDWYKAKDKEKRKNRYKEDVQNDRPEHFREERCSHADRDDEPSDIYRNEKDRQKVIDDDKYRENRDKNIRVERQDRVKEAREDKYRRDGEPGRDRRERKYNRRGDDSDTERDRDRMRKYRDDGSDHEDNYRGVRRDDGRQRRYDDRYNRPEQVEETAAKSKWDSGSESGDDYERTHIEELPTRSSSSARPRRDENQASTSMSGTVKLEIDISKINQLKLLNKMMKAKNQRDTVSDQSSDSSDENELKSKKKQKKEKQLKKKTKKDKKKHADSDSENEDSVIKPKKKKKTKKKKKNYGDDSDDDGEIQKKEKRKKKHLSSETEDSSVDGFKSKKKYKEAKKRKKYDSESDNSVAKVRKAKSKRSKERDTRKYESSEEEFIRKKRIVDKQRKTSKYHSESEERSVRNSRDKQKSARDDYRDFEKKSKERYSRRDLRDQSDDENKYRKEKDKQRKKALAYNERMEEKISYSRHRNKSNEKYDEGMRITSKKGRKVSEDSASDEDDETHRHNRKAREHKKEPSGSDEECSRKQGKSKQRRSYESGGSDDRSFSDVMKEVKQYKQKYPNIEEKEPDGIRKKLSKSGSPSERGDRMRAASGSNSESDNGCTKRSVRSSKEIKELPTDMLIAEEKRSLSKEKRNIDDYKSEKANKRIRSPSSRSKSRSRSRSKILKSETQKKRYSSESDSGPDERYNREKKKKRTSSTDEEQVPRKYEDGRYRNRNREDTKTYGRDSISPRRTQRYDKDRRSPKTCEEKMVLKERHRREKDDSYDEDYRSRKKREVDKGRSRHSSSDNSSDSGSNSESDSEKESRNTKSKGQKNAEAGTGSKMGPVPGTPPMTENTDIEIQPTGTEVMKDLKEVDNRFEVEIGTTKCNPLDRNSKILLPELKLEFDNRHAATSSKEDNIANITNFERSDKTLYELSDNGPDGEEHRETSSTKHSTVKDKKDKDKTKHKKKQKKRKKKHSDKHGNKDNLNSSTDSYQSSGKNENMPDITKSENHNKPENITVVNIAKNVLEADNNSGKKNIDDVQFAPQSSRTSLLVDYGTDDDTASEEETAKEIVKEVGSEIPVLTGKDHMAVGPMKVDLNASFAVELPDTLSPTPKSKTRISFRLSVDSDMSCSGTTEDHIENDKTDDKRIENIESNDAEENSSNAYSMEKKDETAIETGDVEPNVDLGELYDPFEMLNESSNSDNEVIEKQKAASPKQTEKPTQEAKSSLAVATSPSVNIFPNAGLNTSVTNLNMEPIITAFQGVQSGTRIESVHSPVPSPIGVQAPSTPDISAAMPQNPPACPNATLTAIVQEVVPVPIGTETLLLPTVTIPSSGTFQSSPNVGHIMQSTGPPTQVVQCLAKSPGIISSLPAIPKVDDLNKPAVSITLSPQHESVTGSTEKHVDIKMFIPIERDTALKESKNVTRVSRWDTDEHLKKEKQEKSKDEDLYDPFASDSDSSPPRSPKVKAQDKTDSVAAKDALLTIVPDMSTKSKPEVEVPPSLQYVATTSAHTPLISTSKTTADMSSNLSVTSMSSKPDTQSKITMKFMMGRKIIGKSAIMAEDGEEKNEETHMPKLKLSAPIENFSNVNVPAPAKMTYLETKRAMEKSMQTAEFIQKELEKIDQKESQEMDYKHRPSERRMERSMSEEWKLRNRSRERTRKRTISRDRHSGLSKERQKSESKERSLSRERKGRFLRNRRGSLSKERKRSTSREKKRSSSRDRKSSSLKNRKRSLSKERRSTSREKIRGKESSLRVRLRRMNASRERSMSSEHRHGSASRERVKKRSTSREKRRVRSDSIERRRAKSKSHERRPMSYRDESFERARKRRLNRDVSPRDRHLERRSKSRSQSPSFKREQIGARTKRKRHRKQSSTESSSSDSSDSDSSSSSSSDEDGLLEKKHITKKADLSIKKRKWDKDTTETLEIKPIVSDSEKMKTRSDSVDGSTHDLVVENKLNVLASKATEKDQQVSARGIDKIHCKEDEEPNAFMQVDEEISFKTIVMASPEETDICTEQVDVLNASSPAKSLERSNQLEAQSPEKRKIPLGVDFSNATDQENGEERDGDKSFKDALESTPTCVLKYSAQKQPSGDISPIVKLFDISPNKSDSSSVSIMPEGEKNDPNTVDDCDMSEDAMVNRGKKSNEAKESVSVAKRLTRRQAADQKLVLPPVMSKDMPTRGRRGHRQSSDINSSSSSPSIVESTSEKSDDGSNDCTDLKQPKSDFDIVKDVEMQSERGNVCHVTIKDVKTKLLKLKDTDQREKVEASNILSRLNPIFASTSNSKSGKTDLNIEDIPMPPSSIDENENTVGSKASRNKPKPEEIAAPTTAMVDMDLDEPDETPQNIEIIQVHSNDKDGKRPDLVSIKDVPKNIEIEVIQSSELPCKEESFQTDALKGFSLKLLPNAMKKPKQKLTSQMLEDVFDTNLANPGKPKFRLKLSDEPIKSLSFGPPELHISPKQTVITAAVASFKPLPDENNPVESHVSQTEARIEDIGQVKEKESASTGEQVKHEENIAVVNINENNGTRNKVKETAKPLENTRKSDYLLTPKSEEAIKAENILKMPQISPEQIGKAIQVIGQENLRRLEVLQRESAKLLQGKKIEVVGQRADTTQETASTSLQGIGTISNQSLYDNPSLHKTYEDADLPQLEREKQELLNKLQTQNPGFPADVSLTNESPVFHGHVDTILRSASDREKDDCGTSPRRDRPDSRRERRDDDYDERRSGRGHRERRKGRDNRSRERSRDRDSFRGQNRGRSSRERDRSRERNRKKRHRDENRYRSRRRSRSRTRSRDRRSQSRDQRSRDRRSRSRDRRSRSRGRDRRSRSWERRSRSRDRRSRSRERRMVRRSRSRSRDKRSRSRSRDKDSKLKDNNSKKESALEKFEKELAAKKKVLLQPVTSSPLPSSVTQPLVTQADQNHQFVDPNGHFAQVDQTSAPHFLPQPFPVHQQMQVPMFPIGQTMPDQQFAGFHPDPSMFQPPMGPQFFPEGMPPQMGSAPMQQGPQHFQGPPGPGFHPGMFQPGPGPHPMDANFMPQGHNQSMHMEHYPGLIGPGIGTNLQNDLIPGHPTHHGMGHAPGLLPLPDMGNSQGPPPQSDMERKPALLPLPDMGNALDPTPNLVQSDLRHASGHHTENDSISLILPQGHHERQPGMEIDPVSDMRPRSVPGNQTNRGYNEPEPEEQYDRTPVPDCEIDDEDGLQFKHGFGGPGIPGHPGLKQEAHNKESVSVETKELKRRGKRVSRFEPREEVSTPIEQPVKMEHCADATKIDQPAKNDQLAKTEQPTIIEEIQKTDEKPLKSMDHTGFGKWQPVSPVKKVASADTVSELPGGQFSVVEPQSGQYGITPEDASTDLGLDSTPQNQFEDMSDNDSAAGKPMKMKSRWRRASEAETPPPPPPPSKKYGKQPKEVIKEVKEAKDMEDDEVIPINFDLIDENIHLAERKRSKQMREVRRMVCDCTTCKEDREMGADACGEDCLNRMLFIECGSRCPCGDYCTNKRFQKKQNAGVSPFKTDWKGHGLKALEDLEPGQFVMEYVGEVLDYPLFKKRSKQYSKAGQQHFYFMAINPEEIVDATIKGNISRFINHSCDPNCETQKWTVNGSIRVGFFVRKPIKKDEEITFDYKYEVYGKEAQKCFCGTSICRGWLGGDKRMELKSTRRSASVDELEKKKKELFDDSDKLEEEIERMLELHEGLRNKNDVLNMCRLMVRAEDPEHRLQILRVLENTEETACLRLFLDYHGLPLVWCWMADVKVASSDLKHIMLKVLKKLPITNKTILQDSKILDIVRKWSEAGDGLEASEGTDILETTQEITDTDNTENDDEASSTPPVQLSNINPVSILAAIGDKKSVKKSVKFAEVESSSDSESRASASESDLPGDSVEGDVTSSSQTGSRVKTRRQLIELRRKLLEKHPMQGNLESISDVTQSADADSSSENQSESSQREVTPAESEDTEPENKSVGITEKESEELENIVRAAEIKNLASDLLEHWSSLKELYKIPKKEVLEERKKTERELDSNYEKIALIEERRKKVSGWETVKGRKRKRETSYKDDTDDSDSNLRKTLLATPPRMSKSERRQLFEAQVKAQDEMAAEYQRHQEQMQQEQYEQYEQEQLIQQQHQRQLMQDPSFWYYATQDPNFLPSIGIDPQQFLQQLAMDPVLLQQLMATIPNFQQQLEHLTFMYQQAVLQASRYEMSGQQEMIPHEETEPMTEEHLAFLQQVEAFKLQHLEPSKTVAMAPVEDDDVPPPPSPPKGKAIVLPPNWKTAKDAEGKMYYYHTVTRQTQWDPPNIDTGEHSEDMDLGTPTQDDTTSKAEQKEEREKTTTAAADTSSETSRKLKEQFKTKMSSWIVVCLNPFRKPDCKLGRVASTEDFKHLARKLTHHVMAKELKHCRHVEDLEVNENVKSKAKDFVKKYMTKFGASYKRSGNSPSYE